ncbi:Trypsin [Novipirellula aureliae]|uniref:Trypsin n=1 Tax=Novipirellula aureliae TaxID=2527966 RepID=A0A5C6DKS6_9BACT|nr:trypsin-like serine protease [Novipirellula aureliae]TWU37470.1 Trypsin [Novipirellula aureliae]
MNVTKLTALCTSIIAFTYFAIPANAGLVITADALYLERANQHPYVGWLETEKIEGGTRFGGSGVLIDPHWVLMSAHQVFSVSGDLGSAYNLDSFRFGLGSNFISNRGENMLASELHLHGSYTGGNTGYDLALMYFENPFTSTAPIDIYAGSVAAGMESDIVGYGYYQQVDTTDQILTGDRRAGNNVVIGNDFLYANGVYTRLLPEGHSKYRELGMAGTPGDSGGALVIGGELAAISKWSSLTNNIGTTTGYALIDIDWVNATMALHPSAVPEPNSVLLLLAAVPIVAFVRKRKAASLNHAP